MSGDKQPVVEIYKLMVEMADRVSQRRQSANSFYLSINTGVVGGAALLANSRGHETWLVSLAGIAICVLWARNIESYRSLNDAKFKVIQEFEKQLPVTPYTDEWDIIDPGKPGATHKPFHTWEKVVPWVFGIVHAAQAAYAIPWSAVIACLTNATT